MNTFIVKASRLIPDKLYISLMYYRHFHKFPNLKAPQTFNEKLQWLKLYDHRPEYTMMVDKYAVKQYIIDTIGSQYVVPLLGVWERAEDIDFDSLPEQFVLKTNHDSKGVVICKDKSKLDINQTINFLNGHLRNNGFWYGREWPYKHVKPRILAEEFIEAEDGDLKDYKVLCFNGIPRLIELHSNRFNEKHAQDIYDVNWEKTEIYQGPHTDDYHVKPAQLSKMLELSKLLSKNIRHVRIDWFIETDRLYFGEITFFDGSGYVGFDNPKYDLLLGSWIDLG